MALGSRQRGEARAAEKRPLLGEAWEFSAIEVVERLEVDLVGVH